MGVGIKVFVFVLLTVLVVNAQAGLVFLSQPDEVGVQRVAREIPVGFAKLTKQRISGPFDFDRRGKTNRVHVAEQEFQGKGAAQGTAFITADLPALGRLLQGGGGKGLL